MPALSIEGVQKSFHHHEILKGIDLEVKDGEFLILVGPSGCGKSTLLSIIAGLEDATNGRVLMHGADVTHASPKDRNIAMVFQSYALYPTMTVRENIAFGLKMRGEPAAEIARRVAEVSKILQIEALLDRKPAALSGGQRQRVAMGRAIARNPRLYLFDEPLSNLDAQLRAVMRKEIKKLHESIRCAVVYVTHDQQEAMTLGDRIAVMHEGRIVQLGTPREIYERPRDTFVAGFIGSPAMNFIPTRVSPDGTRLRFDSETSADLAAPPSLRAYAGRDVLLGLRPDAIRLTEGPGDIRARLALFEDTGSETYAYFNLNGRETVCASRDLALKRDRPYAVGLDLARASYFDPATQGRIEA